MKLTELEPQFLRYETRRELGRFDEGGQTVERMHDQVYFPKVDRIEEAQGVKFLCPKCFQANGGKIGTHQVVCWSSSRGVPENADPKPGRWRLVGTGYHDLSLMEEPGRSRSVLLNGGCAWHGFVTNGDVT